MDERRLTSWAAAVDAAATRAAKDVLAHYPYETVAHTIGPPVPEADLTTLRTRLPWIGDDLLAVCRTVGPVHLPDIANGYWMFAPAYLLGVLQEHDDGRPDRIGEPFDTPVDVVVFGSDGGGARYALTVGAPGPVYRLRECAYTDGVYSSSGGWGVTAVAADLDAFLDELLAAVTTFAVDGSIRDL